MKNALELAENLLDIGAVKFNLLEPYTWASGWKSPIYCDNRKLLSYPVVRDFVKTELSTTIFELYPDADMIAGVATAGIPHGALVADLLKMPFVYVRSQPKSHGLTNLIEGDITQGSQVIMIEDLISTGGSSLACVHALRNAGLNVNGLMAIFSYNFEVAQMAFENAKVKLHTLTDYNSLMEVGLAKKIITQDQIATLNDGESIHHSGDRMSNLFYNRQIPLAERLRPQHIDDVIGQSHVLGANGFIRLCLQNKKLPSIIFWGPPGIGKTTLAKILTRELGKQFYTLSAVQAGVKDIREVFAKAELLGNAILFIDEIHRFNKSQQDALLGAVESGLITLIGATTENPSFEVNAALLSRCQVVVLKNLSNDDLISLLQKAITKDEVLKTLTIEVKSTEALLRLSGGDARKLLNLIEMAVQSQDQNAIVIDDDIMQKIATNKMALYDKTGEQHYDIISAFIKSMRGSDPQAAVYWLARMLAGGEDVKFIARRMIVLAAEDIGLANPTALILANATFEAVHKIGMPEARIILSECAIYLATSAKSNTTYTAIDMALDLIKKTGDLPVPLPLRNAPTGLMKNLGYGQDYEYAHSFAGNFVVQEYLPDEIKNTVFIPPMLMVENKK